MRDAVVKRAPDRSEPPHQFLAQALRFRPKHSGVGLKRRETRCRRSFLIRCLVVHTLGLVAVEPTVEVASWGFVVPAPVLRRVANTVKFVCHTALASG